MKSSSSELSKFAFRWLFLPVSLATLALLIVTTVCQLLCAKTGGLIDAVESATVSKMQDFSIMTLKYAIPFVVLPGFALMGITALYHTASSVLRSSKKGLIASAAMLLAVVVAMAYIKSILLPDGVAQTYSLWQRIFVAIGEFDYKRFVMDVVSGDRTPWAGIAIAAAIAFVAGINAKRDPAGRLLYLGFFGLGAVLSIATGALAIEFFSVFDTKHPHFADPVDMPVFWGDTVPLIVIACVLVFCAAFALSWVGWRVLRSRTLIGKVFAFVFGCVSAICVIAWTIVPFIFGLFAIPLFLLVIVLAVAAIFGGAFTKTMFDEFVHDMTYDPPPSSASDDTTTYKSESGEVFTGSGEHPSVITSHSDGASYSLGHDGRYHEMGGNRTLG